MEQDYYDDTLDRIIRKNGSTKQIMVAIEEMSELIKELVKHERGSHNEHEIAEEMADVKIMWDQLMQIFDNEGAVKEEVEFKIDRLNKHMEIFGGYE